MEKGFVKTNNGELYVDGESVRFEYGTLLRWYEDDKGRPVKEEYDAWGIGSHATLRKRVIGAENWGNYEEITFSEKPDPKNPEKKKDVPRFRTVHDDHHIVLEERIGDAVDETREDSKNPRRIIEVDGSQYFVEYGTEYVYDSKYNSTSAKQVVERSYYEGRLHSKKVTDRAEDTVTETDYWGDKTVTVTDKNGTKTKTTYWPDSERVKSVNVTRKSGSEEETTYEEDGKTVHSTYEKRPNGASEYICFNGNGKTLRSTEKIDQHGHGTILHYRDDGKTLSSKETFVLEEDGLTKISFQKTQYDKDENVDTYEEMTPSKRIKKYYEKGKLDKEVRTYTDEKGQTRTDVFDGKGALQEYTIREQKEEVGQDKIPVYKTTYRSYDAQYNLKETVLISSKKGVTTRSTYDSKDKLVKVEVDKPDKSVTMEPSRGSIGKLFGRLFGRSGDRGGAVVSVIDRGSGRREVNEQLQQISRDSSLTSSEKRTARRQVVADYHRGSAAPNARVDAALKKYTTKGGR